MEGQTTGTTLTGGGNEGTPGAGGENLGWRAGLPAELRDHDWLKGFSKVGEFATAALELKGRADKAIVPPGEGATEDERKAYYKALGVPENVDGYTFDLQSIPKDFELGEDVQRWVRDVAHKQHLTPAQAQGLLVDMVTRVAGVQRSQAEADKAEEAAEQKAREEAQAALRKAWEIQTDQQWTERVSGALSTGVKLFGEPFSKAAESAEVGDNLYLIMALDILRQVQLPDRFVKGQQAPNTQSRPGVLQYPWMRKFYGKPADNE